MIVKVYENRTVIVKKDIEEKDGTQHENYATVLDFEFPEYIKKDNEEYLVDDLNKYIVFDTDKEENKDIILDNKYVLKNNITELKEVYACIYLKEKSLDDDMSDKLIWISKKFPLIFNDSIEEKLQLTSEDIDAFNTLYTKLSNLEQTLQESIIEINSIKKEYESVTALILDEESEGE